jgi:hypothetical protein
MIKVTSNSPTIVWQSDNSYSVTTTTGAVQWNGTYKRFEVSNGTNWTPIENTVQLNASTEMLEIMSWVKKKMKEEADNAELEILARKNPAINDLVNQINEKKHQIEMVKSLIKSTDSSLSEVQVNISP